MKKIKYFNTVTGDCEAGLISNLDANGTLANANLLVIEQSAVLKKVSLEDVKDFVGGGAPKFNVIEFDFDKSTTGAYSSTNIPVGAILTKLTVKVDVELVGSPTVYMYINIDATDDVILGLEMIQFFEKVGTYSINLGNIVIGATNTGTAGYTVVGTLGTGTGTFWLEYYTL